LAVRGLTVDFGRSTPSATQFDRYHLGHQAVSKMRRTLRRSSTRRTRSSQRQHRSVCPGQPGFAGLRCPWWQTEAFWQHHVRGGVPCRGCRARPGASSRPLAWGCVGHGCRRGQMPHRGRRRGWWTTASSSVSQGQHYIVHAGGEGNDVCLDRSGKPRRNGNSSCVEEYIRDRTEADKRGNGQQHQKGGRGSRSGTGLSFACGRVADERERGRQMEGYLGKYK